MGGVGAIDINRETGGNLSEVLDAVSATIRERGRIARQVRTLTAEGRLSARILIAMPLLMLGWQWRVNPDNFELLTYGTGLAALVVAGILMVIGIVVGAPKSSTRSPCDRRTEDMEITLILGSMALVAAIAMFWWGVTARPSAGPRQPSGRSTRTRIRVTCPARTTSCASSADTPDGILPNASGRRPRR